MLGTAEFIGKHKAQILENWFREASRAASARGLDRPTFTKVMPRYLSALADAGTARTLGEFAGSRRKHVEAHLAARLRQGFAVEEIVEEFILLGWCVQQAGEGRSLEEQLDPSDMERVWAELHRASAAVTDMFGKHMVEDEQVEKRYLRELQTLAGPAQPPGALSLRERLSEVLALIMEAMGARSTALLLYHPETKQLVNADCVGAEEMESFVTSIDLSSFAGRIASSEDTTVLEDAASTRLTIPESLRRSGIHSLLGVRLTARHTLIGVLYIGVAEERTFTARESRRLEVLGEQLAIHLDNAALYAELTERIQSLVTERNLRENFVAVLAHDLRGPLSAAKFATKILRKRRDGLDARDAKLVDTINRNIDRTDRMIRDLLDVNRVHAGERLPLRLDECDLGATAREVAEEMSAMYGSRFVVKAEGDVHGIWSVDELRRALWNLASNAVKYGAPERPITITARRTREGAEVSVNNEGAPISVSEQADLFRPFSRARARPGGPTGWGLGLTLVRGCAEAHGGRVRVQSDATAGTTFTIELPADARPFQVGNQNALL